MFADVFKIKEKKTKMIYAAKIIKDYAVAMEIIE